MSTVFERFRSNFETILAREQMKKFRKVFFKKEDEREDLESPKLKSKSKSKPKPVKDTAVEEEKAPNWLKPEDIPTSLPKQEASDVGKSVSDSAYMNVPDTPE